MKICAAIPAFNNERTILEVVENTRREVDHVVVIDDGSTDQTTKLAKEAGAHVVTVSKNRGKGHALAIAFQYARESGFDAIITLDADLQHDPSEIPKFIDHYRARKSEIVIGNRLHGKRNIPRIRYGPNRIGIYTFS